MRAQSGFTLLELLVVISVIGILLGVASLKAIPSRQQNLHTEAQRIARLLQLARDEAIVRSRPVAFEGGPEHYRFLVREDNQWRPLQQNDLLRERSFEHAPMQLTLTPAQVEPTNPLRIVFGREPIDRPFVLTLQSGDISAAIRADGVGHFVVE